MEVYMKKKILTLTVSYVLAGIIVLSGFLYAEHQKSEALQRQVANNYQHAFSELVNGMGEIDSALQKSLYATSPAMVSAICTELFGKATSTQMIMGELPVSNYELEQTAGFIAKVGDYAYMLSKNAAAGGTYSEEQYANLKVMSDTATVLSDNLKQLMADINSGALTVTELSQIQNSAAQSEDSAQPEALGESFKVIESEFPEVPSLIYDGPFSEHISKMKPVYLEGKSEISDAVAQNIAAEFMGMDQGTFTVYGERSGNIPAYMLSAKMNGGEIYLEVSKAGGVVINMRDSRSVSAMAMQPEDGVGIAKRFLEEHGFTDMQESYWMVDNNTVTVNFAYTQDDVICYTDLVKVSVALDNGSVTGFESLGYVMSHTDRTLPEVTVSVDEAQDRVSGELTVLSHDLAVIPTGGMYEVLCHEFKCENANGQHYIIYVNAQTGVEEKILILLESENGTLTL
jgi:spore germination protein